MKHLTSPIIALTLLLCAGCMTTNPETGVKEYDQVKTEQVKAIFKPIIAGGVASHVKSHPETKVILTEIAAGICNLNESGLTPTVLRAVVAQALQKYHVHVDPALVGTINGLIGVYELWYAQRTRADLPPESFVLHLGETLCDGITQGLMFFPDGTEAK